MSSSYHSGAETGAPTVSTGQSTAGNPYSQTEGTIVSVSPSPGMVEEHVKIASLARGATDPLLSETGMHGEDGGNGKKEGEEFEDDIATDEEPENTSTFSEGSFSFVIVAPFNSIPFLTAAFVFSLECIIFILILINLVGNDPGNPLGFPAAVTGPVILGQFFALLIAVVTQDDVVSAINLVYEGYQKESMESGFPHISYFKWMMAIGLLTVTGFMGLVTTFFLIATSSDVVELLLNFTAVEFVSLLDNGAFVLAQQGFLGQKNKEMADAITDTKYEIPEKKIKSHNLQIMILVVNYLIMISGWAVIYAQQLSGVYTPNAIIVQFDDELDLRLGVYSGIYELDIRRTSFGYGRNRYIGENGVGVFAYCSDEQAWTFVEDARSDPCEDIIAVSSESTDFDITTTASDPWSVSNDPDRDRFYPMESFQLVIGCEEDIDCGGLDSEGNPRGTCEKNKCECEDPFYGWVCDFEREDTCGIVEADTLSPAPPEGFQTDNREFASSLSILKKDDKIVEVYHRPVFLSSINLAGEGDVIFFTGVRWGFFPLPEILQERNLTTVDELANYFDGTFEDEFEILSFFGSPEFFMSDPIAFNTPDDEETPVGVTWNLVTSDSDDLNLRNNEALLLCAVCNNSTNVCRNNNTCPANGQCDCTNGATGTLCRVTPVRNGFCNVGFFNTGNFFSYDGGDCCESTCSTTDMNTCGFVTINETELINIDYPNCMDPDALCIPTPGDVFCWTRKSRSATRASSNAGVFLSPNGRVMVQTAPNVERVRVLDQLDSQWNPRGDDLTDVRGSRFGERVAFYTPPDDVRSIGSVAGVNVILAVGLYRQNLAGMRMFSWDRSRLVWVDAGDELRLCETACTLDKLDIGSIGSIITLVAGIDGMKTDVYRITYNSTFSSEWSLIGSITGEYSSVSGDGNTVAVVRNQTEISVYSVDNSGLRPTKGGIIPEIGGLAMVESMELSFDGRFLFIATLSSDGNSALVGLNLTKSVPPSRLDLVNIGQLSIQALEAGFRPLSMSLDGSAVAVMIDREMGGQALQAYGYRKNFGWLQVGGDLNGAFPDSQFGVSTEASALTLGADASSVNVSTLFPLCPTNSSSFRISILLKPIPDMVSWSMTSFANVDGDKYLTNSITEECNGCYSDAANFGSTIIDVQGCITQDECLELTYQDMDPENGLTPFYLFRDNTMVWSGIGNVTEQTYTWMNSANCQVSRLTCGSDETKFVLALTPDQAIDETSWYLAAEDGTILDSRANYIPGQNAVWFHEVCVPTNVGQCYSFAIFDTFGDGICCDIGEGRYTLFWDGQELTARNGDDFEYGERIQFGNCPTMITPADAISVTVNGDPNPQDISWYIEDGSGRRIGDSSSVSYVADVTESTVVFLFPDEISGCLFLVMEDASGDGNSGYSLQYNGTEVLTRDGNFLFSERVTFGPSSECSVNVEDSSSVMVTIVLDGQPTETSWYIGDSTGMPLDGTTTGTAAQAGATVMIAYNATSDVGGCLTFNILDSVGDGFCCGAGSGSYSISLGWMSVVSRSGEIGYGERVRFGPGCPGPTEVINAVEVTVDLTVDQNPSQTSWRLEDSVGNLLGMRSYEDVVVDSTTNPMFRSPFFRFPESTGEECFFFTIVDTGGDGICCDDDTTRRMLQVNVTDAPVPPSNATPAPTPAPITPAPVTSAPTASPVTSAPVTSAPTPVPTTSGPTSSPTSLSDVFGNGTFSLLINGQAQYTSDGQFGFGERVQFGTSCNVSVAPVSLLTVDIQLDDKPEETGWAVAEAATGRQVAGAPPGTYNNSTGMVSSSFGVLSGDSYVLTVLDTGGDGLCCAFGNGSYSVLVVNTGEMLSWDGMFGSSISHTLVLA